MYSLVSRAVLNCCGQSMCLRARTAREIVHAIFVYFFGHFFYIFKPFLTENEKTEAIFQIGIDDAHLFHFIHFFPFQSGRPSKWLKIVKIVKKSTYLAKI